MEKSIENRDADESSKKEQIESNTKSSEASKALPLHRRRFDAKQRILPAGLTALPNTSLKSESSKKYCEELIERLSKKDDSNMEELQPLYTRTANTAVAALTTEDAFDHLDKLYRLMNQLLTLKDQNAKIQRRAKDLEHLKKLQEMHHQIEKEMLKTKTADSDAYLKNEATSMDMGEEYEYTEALLDSMLAAGRNASLKRAKWKSPSRSKLRQSVVRNQRSRSMGGEELESCPLPERDYSSHLDVPYKGRSSRTRRSSDAKTNGEKSKISKWTRVKAAFKWEKAHTGIAGDPPTPVKSSIPLIQPSTPLVPASPATPAVTPASISPASSTEEMRDNENACRPESSRRSRSLDSSVVLDPISGQMNQEDEMSSPSSAKMHKTPWGKMKDIIQTRKESVRKKQNRNSMRSTSDGRTSENYSLSDCGGLSQAESTEVLQNTGLRTPVRKISGQERSDVRIQELSDPTRRTTPTLTITMPSSEELTVKPTDFSSIPPSGASKSNADGRGRHLQQKQKSMETSKRTSSRTAQDSSDPDTGSPVAQRHDSKWKKVKKAFLTSASASTPSSPSRHSAFFSYEPDDVSGSEQTDQARGELEKEIRRDYKALQNRLNKEFCEKIAELNASGSTLGILSRSSSGGRCGNQRFSKKMDDWDKTKSSSGKHITGSGPPTPCEERLSADFKKKLQDWQKSKGINSNITGPATSSSFVSVPSHAQLSEDFRKKLEEWKKLKATNSVPSYTGYESDRLNKDHDRDDKTKYKKLAGPQKKEVLVQTGAGFFRFEGISRSFTRKLYEWEKSRGIAPEVSTSALLRESLARPPLPKLRMSGYGPWPGLPNAPYQKGERGVLRLQRSLSVGSVRDETAPHISASASSLSLTNLDECNGVIDNQISDIGEDGFDTSIEVENRPTGTESDSDGGPGAVLVEIEDEVEETAAPLVACSPCAAPQTPIYRYGQAQERHRACENTEGKLSPIAQAITIPLHPFTEQIINMKNGVNKLLQEEDTLQKLISGLKNVKERCNDVSKRIEEVKGQPLKIPSQLGDMERRLNRLNKEGDILKNSLKCRIRSFNDIVSTILSDTDPSKSKCEESSAVLLENSNLFKEKILNLQKLNDQRVESENMCDNNLIGEIKDISIFVDQLKLEYTKNSIKKKDNSLCVSYVVTKPRVNSDSIEITEAVNKSNILSRNSFKSIEKMTENKSSNEEHSDNSLKGAKKKSKNVIERTNSNSAKRKSKARQRLEREKSMHSESDTEGDINTVTVEFPKRKKYVKSRCSSETHVGYKRQNSYEKQSTDSGENVFVLKLKSKKQDESFINETINENDSTSIHKSSQRSIVMNKRSLDSALENMSTNVDESLEFIIPKQLSMSIPSEDIEVQTGDETNVRPDIFVKTTRKIFSPVRRDSSGETKAVIGFDLEEIANSIKNRALNANLENQSQENLPDIIINNEKKTMENVSAKFQNSESSEMSNQNECDDHKRPYKICGSGSLNNMRSHSPSPLFLRKQAFTNSSTKIMSGYRNESEESIYQSKDTLVPRRGSGERSLIGCKGSPILSRASTPGINGAPSSLPPLPASPPSARRDKPPTKETAPSIRIMIQKYNMRLNEEGETRPQTGNSTPPWRSPRSQERFPHDVRRLLHQSVRNNPFIDREVQKSASASQIMRNQTHENRFVSKNNHSYSKDNVSDSSGMTPPLPKKLLRGILKSSSAGSLKTTSPLCQRKDFNVAVNNNKQKIYDVSIKKDQEPSSVQNSNSDIIGSFDREPSIARDNTNKEEPKKKLDDHLERYGKIIDANLLKLAKSSTCIPIQSIDTYASSMTSCSRAMKLKKAKEQFLASGQNNDKDRSNMLRKERTSSSNVDLAENRLSQLSDTSYDDNSLINISNGSNYDNSLLIKSASVGMINVERDAYDKISREKGYESLPRNRDITSSKDQIKSGSKFGLSNLASKFRKVRMRNKNKQIDKNGEKEKLDTVSKLCRQSLLVNLHGATGSAVNPEKCPSKSNELSHSPTNKSIFLAGKTGSVVAMNNEDAFTTAENASGAPGCSKASK